MNNAPTLVVMAAGMGSRFGGLKQIAPITENGEVILDFSVFDAQRAGFGDVIFVIKKELEPDFEQAIGTRLRQHINIRYAYQELSDIPSGFSIPDGRVKPWGTAHAVRSVRGMVDGPFAVINADDFYGMDAFRAMAEALAAPQKGPVPEYAMVGYRLGNTLTDYGSVARGVCRVENDLLQEIQERTNIVKKDGAAAFSQDNGETWHPLGLDTIVSMQFFGFQPDFIPLCEAYFLEFLRSPMPDPLKSECFLPGLVGEVLQKGQAVMRVLPSSGQWFGVTYAEDKPMVKQSIAKLRAQGAYPPSLW